MTAADIYQQHHEQKGRLGFSILEQERAQWFSTYLKKDAHMLDLGCRDATLTRHFQPQVASILGVDVDPSALEKAKITCPTATFMSLDLLGDWHEIQGKTFDVILCSEVLEHLYFPERIIAHVQTHLAPGGVFIGSVPNAFFLKHRLRYLAATRKNTPLEDPTHITQFNEAYLREVLSGVSSDITVQGYTRPPLQGFAKRWPGMFAFDFLFAVRKRSAS